MFYSTIINLLSISDIRKSPFSAKILKTGGGGAPLLPKSCLLYTSDAADD